MSAFGDWLVEQKCKLPYNGDWLYVTADPPRKSEAGKVIVQVDLASGFDEPLKVLSSISTESSEILDLLLTRSKDYEREIYSIADTVRDKAKAQLSSATFISAVLFGIFAFFLYSLSKSELWVVVVEFAVYFLMLSQFVRALYLGVAVLTREEAISAPIQEILSFGNSDTSQILELKRAWIAQTIAYANRTHEKILTRVSRLIFAQVAFRNGLVYLLALFLFHMSALVYVRARSENEMQLQSQTANTKIQKLDSAAHAQRLESFDNLDTQVAGLRKAAEHIDEKLDSLLVSKKVDFEQRGARQEQRSGKEKHR